MRVDASAMFAVPLVVESTRRVRRLLARLRAEPRDALVALSTKSTAPSSPACRPRPRPTTRKYFPNTPAAAVRLFTVLRLLDRRRVAAFSDIDNSTVNNPNTPAAAVGLGHGTIPVRVTNAKNRVTLDTDANGRRSSSRGDDASASR